MNFVVKFLSSLLVLFIISSCASSYQPLSDRNSQLTQGNVQLSIQVGVTSKALILEKFGSPNVTTRDSSGKEMWSYQRSAQVAQSSTSSGYWNIIIAGKSKNNSGFESSSRMVTLIIKFDNKDIVSDFRSRTSNF